MMSLYTIHDNYFFNHVFNHITKEKIYRLTIIMIKFKYISILFIVIERFFVPLQHKREQVEVVDLLNSIIVSLMMDEEMMID